MFNNFNKKFITLSKSINCFLNNKQLEYNFKIRNTTLIDGCLFKLLSSEINSTHEKTTLKINQYNNKNISRIAYYKRSEQLDINFYKNLSEHISNKINSLFYKNNNQKIILAVDGIYSQFKTSVSNNNLNKNNDSVTNLITGIYNLSYNTPELMQIEEKKK